MGMAVRSVVAILVSLAVVVNTAAAGVLAVDGNALPAFRGTKGFDITLATWVLISEVDYAVYAPGQFEASFGVGSDPSAGTHYVYAYQLFNDPGNQGANRELTELTVGFTDLVDLVDDIELPANMGFLPNAFGDFGLDPFSSTLFGVGPGSAVWSYIGSPIPVSSKSEILLYTSPYPPEFDAAAVKGGIGTGVDMDNHILPSPNSVPEPGTLALGMLGMVLLVTRRMWRRRRHS